MTAPLCAHCAWCDQRIPPIRRDRYSVGQVLYCNPRCSQAARDYRRKGCGTPGVRPRRMLVNQ